MITLVNLQTGKTIICGDSIPQPDGTVGFIYPIGSNTVISVQPNGEVDTRLAVGGPYEKFCISGNLAAVYPDKDVYVFGYIDTSLIYHT